MLLRLAVMFHPGNKVLWISQSLVWLCCGPFRSNNCVAVHGWLLMWSEEPLCINHAEVRMAAAASTLICVLATIHSSQSASCRLMQAHAYGRSPSWFLTRWLEHSTATLLFKIQKELTLPKTTKNLSLESSWENPSDKFP